MTLFSIKVMRFRRQANISIINPFELRDSRKAKATTQQSWFCLAGALFLLSPKASAHPAHAEPVNYPFVVAFERFYTSLDQADHLANGGLILLNELNCVACHKPPNSLALKLGGRPGTRLAGVASRFEELDLEMMVRNPRFVKTDTIMPSFFSGPDRDLDEIEALKHFLSSLSEPLPSYPEGDLEAGRILYHKVGCVSCHAPEKDYRPPWIPDNVEVYLAGLPSVPMNLADRYPREAIIDLLLNPTKHRPAGRMPRFDLTEKEAVDIGTYLNATPKPELPEILKRALAKSEPFQADPVLIAKGKELFGRKNCVACHSGIVDAKPILSLPLAQLQTGSPRGCLSERPPGGLVPAYGLDELQKKAIVAALQSLPRRAGESSRDGDEIDWTFSVKNCYACHERDGKGGLESAREVYFTVEQDDALGNGRFATHPPVLDKVGAKLKDEWWTRVLYSHAGDGSVRDFMSARMPRYRPFDLGSMVEILQKVDEGEDRLIGKGDSGKGHQLVGIQGKNCVACHGLGDLPPPGAVSLDLNDTTQRLRPGYFAGFLEDPPFGHEKLTSEEVSHIWAYLSGIDQYPLPDGLLRPDRTEQIPGKRTIVLRNGLRDIVEDAVLVGFPGAFNAAFDIENCRWVVQWKGRFVDPGPDWKSEEPVPVVPLEKYQELQGIWKPVGASYLGYDLDRRGNPTMFYETEDGLVSDRLNEDGTRVITIGEKMIREKWEEATQ